MDTQQTTSLDALFGSAQSQGVLSNDSMAAIKFHDIGADIQDALGVNIDDVKSSEVTLVTFLIDDSYSIRHAENEVHIRDGYNLAVDSLKGTKQKASILALCRYLNGTVLYAYRTIEQSDRMDNKNYNATGGTPLYDQAVTTLATIVAKAQDFTDNGIACRSITLIVTDGADAGSHKSTAYDVSHLVKDLLRQECHIVAFMGIWDGDVDAAGDPIPGTGTDFEAIAKSMGIPDEWVLTPKNSPSEIRRAFNMFSQSASRVSQAAGASFSAAAMGGFNAP